jgi:uncharacterized Tic20 family protein/DNA-binding XRE family transcriptional regulator
MEDDQLPFTSSEKARVAQNLRQQRRRKGWTQEQLAERSRVTVRTIQRIENAQVEPQLQTLALLAGALELDVQQLSPTPVAEEENSGEGADLKWLLLLHLSPLVGLLLPFANLLAPLLLWLYHREKDPLVEAHGRAVVNFHLTATLVFMAGVALLLVFFEAGILLLLLVSAYTLALTLLNTRRVAKNESYRYPFSIPVL